MLLPNFYHPFFLYCVKTPTNDDGNFGELEFLCTFVAKSKPLSKTRQSIANRTVSKSLPEHQPIVRNTLLQRVVAFLSKVTQNIRKARVSSQKCSFATALVVQGRPVFLTSSRCLQARQQFVNPLFIAITQHGQLLQTSTSSMPYADVIALQSNVNLVEIFV